MIDLDHSCPKCNGPLNLEATSGMYQSREGQVALKVDVLITCEGECQQVWNEFLDFNEMMTLNNPEVGDGE